MRAVLVWTVLLLTGASLAGCITDEKVPDVPEADEVTNAPPVWVLDKLGNTTELSAFAGELPSFVLHKASDRISGEPTLGVTRTGAVFYAAIDFDVEVPQYGSLPRTDYVRTSDGGETWEVKNPQMGGVDTHPTSFDPYVYVDPTTGRVYAMDMGPHVACNKVSWSDDDGESWVTRDGACIPGANDHPTLFAGPAAPWTNTAVYPNQLYLCTNQITDSLCYQSPDGGINWFATVPAYIGYDPTRVEPATEPNELVGNALEGLCGGLHGHGHASWADGTVYLGRGYCGEVQVAVSSDFGATFDVVTISDDPYHAPSEHDVSVGTDRAGNAYALWIGDRSRSVFLSTSSDQGASWSEPINVTAPGVTAARLPSLVAGEEGRIAFLYIGTENPYGHQVGARVDGCDDAKDPACYEHPDVYNNTTWNAYIGMSLNANTDAPVFATTYANPVDEPLKRGTCSGRCFGDQGGMYDFLDIDMDPMTGQVWAALVDVCHEGCDGPDIGKFDAHEKSVGVVAKLVTNTTLLDAPWFES